MKVSEIFTTRDHKIMDTFIIQDRNNNAVTDETILNEIRERLLKALKSGKVYDGKLNTRKSRQLKAFDHPSTVRFEQDYLNSRTVMEISALDMPGLLSVIANEIARMDISITHAKISTLGEKIDDIFYLTTPDGKAITDSEILDTLRKNLIEALDSRKAA